MRSCGPGAALVVVAFLAAAALASADSASPKRVLRKRSCVFGLNSHHCSLSELDGAMRSRERLRHGFGPGKRADPYEDDFFALARGGNSALGKRSCRLRLGGLCLTESLDRAASQLHYLQSPISPGRRRRDLQAQRPLQDRKPALQRHLARLARAALLEQGSQSDWQELGQDSR